MGTERQLSELEDRLRECPGDYRRRDAECVPTAEAIIRFDDLSKLGTAPLNPKLTLMNAFGQCSLIQEPVFMEGVYAQSSTDLCSPTTLE